MKSRFSCTPVNALGDLYPTGEVQSPVCMGVMTRVVRTGASPVVVEATPALSDLLSSVDWKATEPQLESVLQSIVRLAVGDDPTFFPSTYPKRSKKLLEPQVFCDVVKASSDVDLVVDSDKQGLPVELKRPHSKDESFTKGQGVGESLDWNGEEFKKKELQMFAQADGVHTGGHQLSFSVFTDLVVWHFYSYKRVLDDGQDTYLHPGVVCVTVCVYVCVCWAGGVG